jgi:hypothetical protein
MKKLFVICALIGALIIGGSILIRQYGKTQFDPLKTSTPGNPFPDVFRTSFMSSCDVGKENCECVLIYLQENYSYDDVKKGNSDDKLVEAVNYCKSKN